MLEIIELQGKLVVDSTLIADELEIEHKNLVQTIRTYETTLETRFGDLLRETRTSRTHDGRQNQKTTIYLLNENQATFITMLSRNTTRVVEAKLNLVAAFSKAKEKLQQHSVLSSATLDAVLSRLDRVEKVAEAHQKIDDTLKYADEHLPGLKGMVEEVGNNLNVLPSVDEPCMSAPSWIMRNKINLSDRQRACFFNQLADVYRQLVGRQPQKNTKNCRVYEERYYFLFSQVLDSVTRNY